MRNLLDLSARLARGGGLLGGALTIAAVAVSTGLLLFAIAANVAFEQRAAREVWPANDAEVYSVLALIAAVLVVVPLLVFGGAAARLTVARRDRRLAALRLIGATPAQVVAMTTAEAVITAAVGAVFGTILYALSMPLLARIPIRGGTWYVSDLWVGVLPLLGVLVAVPLLVGVSAIAGLRRIVVSPLGVARRQRPPGMRAVRVIVLVAAIAVVPLVSRNAAVGVIAVVIGVAFLAINLAGPWFVSIIGRIMAATARRPARLLAGRRLVDDPRSAWRTVAGVALTGFVAGFIGLLSPPGEQTAEGMMFLADIRTGTRVVLVVSFLVAIVSAAITAASSILDRRETYALLSLAGTPLRVLDQARAQETLLPLLVMGGGSVAAGVVCALPFAVGGLSGSGAVVLAIFVVAGFAGVAGAGLLTRPLLRSVVANPAPRPD